MSYTCSTSPIRRQRYIYSWDLGGGGSSPLAQCPRTSQNGFNFNLNFFFFFNILLVIRYGATHLIRQDHWYQKYLYESIKSKNLSNVVHLQQQQQYIVTAARGEYKYRSYNMWTAWRTLYVFTRLPKIDLYIFCRFLWFLLSFIFFMTNVCCSICAMHSVRYSNNII
jgi:hypothetical protein